MIKDAMPAALKALNKTVAEFNSMPVDARRKKIDSFYERSYSILLGKQIAETTQKFLKKI